MHLKNNKIFYKFNCKLILHSIECWGYLDSGTYQAFFHQIIKSQSTISQVWRTSYISNQETRLLYRNNNLVDHLSIYKLMDAKWMRMTLK